MYKNNSRDSSNIKGCSPFQLSCNLIGKCHAVGYYSYTNRWVQAQKKRLLRRLLQTEVNQSRKSEFEYRGIKFSFA